MNNLNSKDSTELFDYPLLYMTPLDPQVSVTVAGQLIKFLFLQNTCWNRTVSWLWVVVVDIIIVVISTGAMVVSVPIMVASVPIMVVSTGIMVVSTGIMVEPDGIMVVSTGIIVVGGRVALLQAP